MVYCKIHKGEVERFDLISDDECYSCYGTLEFQLREYDIEIDNIIEEEEWYGLIRTMGGLYKW